MSFNDYPKAVKEFSKWELFNKYSEPKKEYYIPRKSPLTDEDYYALERSILAIQGISTVKAYGWVGYNKKPLMAVFEVLERVEDSLSVLVMK